MKFVGTKFNTEGRVDKMGIGKFLFAMLFMFLSAIFSANHLFAQTNYGYDYDNGRLSTLRFSDQDKHYKVDYIYDQNGNLIEKQKKVVNRLDAPSNTDLSAVSYEIVLYGVPPEVQEVSFPTWSRNNGQDDIVWHEGQKITNGIWRAVIPFEEHDMDFGEYETDVYVEKIKVGNSVTLVGLPTLNIQKPIQVSLNDGSYEIMISGVAGGVSKVAFPTWTSVNGQDDLENPWVVGEKMGSDTWRIKISLVKHNNELGSYITHIYSFDNEGSNPVLLGIVNVEVVVDINAPRQHINQINNPMFEQYTGADGLANGWGKYYYRTNNQLFQLVSAPVTSGSRAQKVTSTNILQGGLIYVLQDITAEGNKPYTTGAQVRKENVTQAKVFLLVQFFDANNHFLSQTIQDYPKAINDSYNVLSVSGQTPEGTKRVRVHVGMEALANGGGGSFYVDDMFFQYDPEGNLVGNPTFEYDTGTSGLADGWGKYLYRTNNQLFQTVSAPVTSGSRAQKVTSTNMLQGGLIYVLQDITAEGNKPYTTGAQVRKENVTQAKVFLLVQFFDENNYFLGQTIQDYPEATNDSYNVLSVSDRTPEGTKRVRVHVGMEALANGGGGSFYVDDTYFRYAE